MAPTIVDCVARERVKFVSGVNPLLAPLTPIAGPFTTVAARLQKELSDGVPKPFNRVVRATLGDMQAAGHQPLTYIRQMVACATYPPLLTDSTLPADVRAAARTFLDSCEGGTLGSYSHGEGLSMVRHAVQQYLAVRDGSAFANHWQRVAMTDGATAGLTHCFALIANSHPTMPTGILIPAPRYHMYTALATVTGLRQLEYFLDEGDGWQLEIEDLERALSEGRKEGSGQCFVRALLVTNPGNPTGQVLSRRNMEEIVMFAHRHQLLLITDEVYQHNVYDEGSKFYSFKKVVCEMAAPYCETELASLMSVSKGLVGECGARGGWLEVMNLSASGSAAWRGYSYSLLPNVFGQMVVYCLVAGPRPGDSSYPLWEQERLAAAKLQRERTLLTAELLGQAKGISCHTLQGALYAFPCVKLPPGALRAAANASMSPDKFYVLSLLEETGLCVTPGVNFAWPLERCKEGKKGVQKILDCQKEANFLPMDIKSDGTSIHVRVTTLLPTPLLRAALLAWRDFHTRFTLRYSSQD